MEKLINYIESVEKKKDKYDANMLLSFFDESDTQDITEESFIIEIANYLKKEINADNSTAMYCYFDFHDVIFSGGRWRNRKNYRNLFCFCDSCNSEKQKYKFCFCGDDGENLIIILLKSAELNNIYAQAYICLMFVQSEYKFKDIKDATKIIFNHMVASAEKGHPLSQHIYGEFIFTRCCGKLSAEALFFKDIDICNTNIINNNNNEYGFEYVTTSTKKEYGLLKYDPERKFDEKESIAWLEKSFLQSNNNSNNNYRTSPLKLLMNILYDKNKDYQKIIDIYENSSTDLKKLINEYYERIIIHCYSAVGKIDVAFKLLLEYKKNNKFGYDRKYDNDDEDIFEKVHDNYTNMVQKIKELTSQVEKLTATVEELKYTVPVTGGEYYLEAKKNFESNATTQEKLSNSS